MTNVHYGIIGGAFAALGSVFGKLSWSPTFEDFLIGRLIMLGVMILCNTISWYFFAKSLLNAKTSLHATAITTSSNYILSGVFGVLFFDEITSLYWWAGIGLILIGLYIVISEDIEKRDDLLDEINSKKIK